MRHISDISIPNNNSSDYLIAQGTVLTGDDGDDGDDDDSSARPKTPHHIPRSSDVSQFCCSWNLARGTCAVLRILAATIMCNDHSPF